MARTSAFVVLSLSLKKIAMPCYVMSAEIVNILTFKKRIFEFFTNSKLVVSMSTVCFLKGTVHEFLTRQV